MLTGLILSGKGLFFRNARAIALFFLYVFHVSGRGAVRFPFVKRRFSPAETYVSRKENIENVGRFVQICPCSERFLKCFLEYCMRKSRLLRWTGASVSCVLGCFSGFWPSCKEISCRIFPSFRCSLVPVRCASLPFPFTHAPMCAYTRPREIHNVVSFAFLFVDLKKYSPATVLFSVAYKNLQKFLKKRVR